MKYKFVSLLSSGFDSPIAIYLLMKGGFKPIILNFLTSDDKNRSMRKKVLAVIEKLSVIQQIPIKAYFINHDPNLELFIEKCDRKLTCILCKRLMIRISQEIANKENTNIIATGDILAEQASQTLSNLYSYNNLLRDAIILRPLIGFNKMDVIEITRKIDLYDLLSQSTASCQFYPQYPETNAKLKDINYAESLINFTELVEQNIERAEILEV